MPTGDLTGADIVVTSGAAAGKSVALGTVAGKTVGFGFGANPAVVNSIQIWRRSANRQLVVSCSADLSSPPGPDAGPVWLEPVPERQG